MLICVPDTNVIVALHRSANPDSPNKEFLRRWSNEEFVLAYSSDTIIEYAEKLTEHDIPDGDIEEFLGLIFSLGRLIRIDSFHFQHYPVDPDDIAFILCASNGEATHLVSYDQHLLDLDQHYSFRICRTVDFLHDLRVR